LINGEGKEIGEEMSKWESLRSGWAYPCGGFWVSVGVSVGKTVHEFFPRTPALEPGASVNE